MLTVPQFIKKFSGLLWRRPNIAAVFRRACQCSIFYAMVHSPQHTY